MTPTTSDAAAGTSPAVRTRIDGWPGRLAKRLRPPEPWQYRPASLAAMWRYARIGGWTAEEGVLRLAGKVWFWLIALPTSLVTHYLHWIVVRPSRTLTVAVLYVVAAHTTPGSWLLPWPTWLP